MTFSLPIAWVLGLALAVARAGAMVASCALVPRSIPKVGRGVFALAVGLLLAQPVADASIGASDLAVAAFTNVIVGITVGWFLGLAVHLFQIAGTLVDLGSGVTIGSVFDPDTGGQPGPFTRFYSVGAQALIVAGGGLMVVIQVAWASTRAIALDGRLRGFSMLGSVATERFSLMFRQAVELALPVVGVLFVAELAFGLLSRLAPQVNMFLVSLPLKTLMSISMVGGAAMLFPRYADQVLRDGVDVASRLLGG